MYQIRSVCICFDGFQIEYKLCDQILPVFQ